VRHQRRSRQTPSGRHAKVTDVARFIDAVRDLIRRWTLPNADWYPVPWFRGHGDARWALEPGWYRLPPPAVGVGEAWYNESTLLVEFKLRAPRYIDLLPRSDWEWLFWMQHYGLPTRLLDWSESSLIALYFAVRDHQGRGDAAVWVLNPWRLNKQSLGAFEIPDAGSPRVAAWGPVPEGKRLEVGPPVAIKPVHASPRIAAQKGFFTIHGTERGALERLARREADRGPGLVKLVIPGSRVVGIKSDLEVAGVTETTIFQELDGLAREIKAGFLGI